MYVHPTESLFDAVSHILGSIGMRYSAQQLRHVVAKQVLNVHDTETNSLLSKWRERLFTAMHQRHEMQVQQLKHAWPLIDLGCDTSNVITKRVRENIRDAMLDPLAYAGDFEHALRVLRQGLCLEFIVIQPSGPIMQTPALSQPQYGHAAILFHHPQHNSFQCVAYKQKYVFPRKDLPTCLFGH